MKEYSIEEIIRKIYDKKVDFIRNKNTELERKYFNRYSSSIPLNDILAGASFDDHFYSFKEKVKNGKDYEIENIFELLEDYFLFSYGYDMMFKKKLEADIFTAPPIENLIYPIMEEKVKTRYNDVSVMKQNPNLNKNIDGIDDIIYTYMELQSLLYLLYCNDFQFPNGWEGISPKKYEEIINILDESGMTIGEFLHALVEHKCGIMKDILNNIGNTEKKQIYLNRLENLKDEKHKEVDTFTHINLPVTYFKNHTMLDFLEEDLTKSSILENNNKEKKKIIIK